MTTYAEFRIRIERGTTPGSFRVEASGLGGEQHGSFDVPFSDTEIENFILKIGRTRRGVRRIESPEMDLARSFGERLFKAVMHDKVGELYRSAFTAARADRQGLRITLSLTDVPELGAIPWEYLFDPPDFLAVSSWTPVVRYLDLPRPRRALEMQLPLRILAVVSAPSDVEQLDVSLEREKLTSALRPLIDANAVTIDWLERPSLLALAKQLRPDTYHILHFIGHGGFDDRSEEGALLFEDDLGRGRLVSGDQLGTILHDKLNLRLVLLNSCEGARNSAKDPFSGVATSLVERDIPAVIGMQFEITDRAAILFASEFYAMLAEGQPVDQAIAEARLAIFADQNDVEWGTPVLFMRVADGRLFDVAQTAQLPRPSKDEVTAIADHVAASEVAHAVAEADVQPAVAPAVADPPRTEPRTAEPPIEEPGVAEPAAPASPGATSSGRELSAAATSPIAAPMEPTIAAPPPAPAPTPTPAVDAHAGSPASGSAPIAAPPIAVGGGGALPVAGASAGTLAHPQTLRERLARQPWKPIAITVAVVWIVLTVIGLILFPPAAGANLHSSVNSATGTVTITGTGFRAGETVALRVDGTQIGTTTAAADGSIQLVYGDARSIAGHYTATGDASGESAGVDITAAAGPTDAPTEEAGGPSDAASDTATETPTGTDDTAFTSPAAPICPAGENGGLPAIADPPRILFYSNHSDLDDGTDRELFAVEPTSRELCQLTQNDVDDSFPTWSPDHQGIAFTRHDADGNHIWIWGPGSTPTQLTFGDNDFFPTWSSTGWIAYIRGSGASSEIREVQPNGEGDHGIFTENTIRAIAWSPAGDYLAFMALFDRRDFDLGVVGPDGSGFQRLNREGTNELNPAPSADGRTLVFVQDRGASGSADNEIRTMSVSSEAISGPLTENDVQDGNPVWSPTDDRIAFYRRSDHGFDLFTMAPDGGDVRPLVVRDGQNLDPAWR